MDRKQHWEKIYSDNSPQQVSWFQEKPELSLQLMANSGFAKDASVIDVGGGCSMLVDHLLAGGYSHLSVLDISEQALQLSQQRLGDQATQVYWHATDITSFQPAITYDLWHDRAVFHFLTNESDRQRYLETLLKGTHEGSQIIIAAFAIDGPTQCSGLDIVQYDAEKLCQTLGEAFVLQEEQYEAHSTPSGMTQQFNYYRLKRR